MFYVYAIYNQKHKKIYIGQTLDLEQRIKLHNEGVFEKGYTARFDGGWKLVYQETHKTRSGALVRERQLKSYQGRQFVKNLINIPL